MDQQRKKLGEEKDYFYSKTCINEKNLLGGRFSIEWDRFVLC